MHRHQPLQQRRRPNLGDPGGPRPRRRFPCCHLVCWLPCCLAFSRIARELIRQALLYPPALPRPARPARPARPKGSSHHRPKGSSLHHPGSARRPQGSARLHPASSHRLGVPLGPARASQAPSASRASQLGTLTRARWAQRSVGYLMWRYARLSELTGQDHPPRMPPPALSTASSAPPVLDPAAAKCTLCAR